MRASRRRVLAALALAAATAVLALSPLRPAGANLADEHPCQHGTNWDNVIGACR